QRSSQVPLEHWQYFLRDCRSPPGAASVSSSRRDSSQLAAASTADPASQPGLLRVLLCGSREEGETWCRWLLEVEHPEREPCGRFRHGSPHAKRFDDVLLVEFAAA